MSPHSLDEEAKVQRGHDPTFLFFLKTLQPTPGCLSVHSSLVPWAGPSFAWRSWGLCQVTLPQGPQMPGELQGSIYGDSSTTSKGENGPAILSR